MRSGGRRGQDAVYRVFADPSALGLDQTDDRGRSAAFLGERPKTRRLTLRRLPDAGRTQQLSEALAARAAAPLPGTAPAGVFQSSCHSPPHQTGTPNAAHQLRRTGLT